MAPQVLAEDIDEMAHNFALWSNEMTDLISDHLAKLDLTRQVHYTKMHSIDLLVKDLIESLHQTLG